MGFLAFAFVAFMVVMIYILISDIKKCDKEIANEKQREIIRQQKLKKEEEEYLKRRNREISYVS